jgi:hypothetical protein
VFEPTSIIEVAGNVETHETGTATTVAVFHVVGITIVVGITTTDDVGKLIISDPGILAITLDGTELGNELH